ncbi:MAG TPA: site-specific integrase [Dehalococcoidia bacterium]|nr:site-specific integrase [Dehalococcoidia bacterium]
MRGRTFQRGKTWSYVVDVGDGPDGNRRQQTRGGFRTQAKAQEALNLILVEVQQDRFVEPTRETVTTFMRRWLDSCRASVRPSTWAQRHTLIEEHILPALGGVRLQKLTPAMLNTLYGDLLANGRHVWVSPAKVPSGMDPSTLPSREKHSSNGPYTVHKLGRGGLSPRTVGHIHGVLRLALNEALRWQLLSRNVADQATAPKKRPTAMRTWSAAEARAFLATVRDDRLFAAYALALITGLRRGELLGLAWRDVDLDPKHGWLNVRQTVISVNFKLQLSTPKTAAGRRTVALDRDTVELLQEHRLQQLAERTALGLAAQQPDDFVFAGIAGEPLHPGLFVDAFDRRVKVSGVPRIRFHDLRHTSATLALAAGVHPKVVQERLGHASISITLDLYSHTIPSLQEEAAAKLAGIVLAAPRDSVIKP